MKTHFATKALSVAIASLFAGTLAFAGTPDHDPVIPGAAAAAAINTQTTGGETLAPSSTLAATIDGNAAQNASGNIGINATSGVSNAQSNNAAMATTAANEVFGIALVDNSQQASGHAISGGNIFMPVTTNASLTDNALNGASGNIGVNVSTGAGNTQSNDLAVTNANTKDLVGAAITLSNQSATDNQETGVFHNSAIINDAALGGAKGNVAVNVTSGAGNVQDNAVALTKADSTLAAAVAGVSQSAAGNTEAGLFTNSATFGGNALVSAAGNIAVNLSAGAGNVQQNSLAMVVRP